MCAILHSIFQLRICSVTMDFHEMNTGLIGKNSIFKTLCHHLHYMSFVIHHLSLSIFWNVFRWCFISSNRTVSEFLNSSLYVGELGILYQSKCISKLWHLFRWIADLFCFFYSWVSLCFPALLKFLWSINNDILLAVFFPIKPFVDFDALSVVIFYAFSMTPVSIRFAFTNSFG